jgi:hypothetical protein
LDEGVECIEFVPVLDEASVFDPPDVDRAHGEGVARRGIAKEVSRVRALIAVATHYACPVCRDEDVLGEYLEVGHAREDRAEDLLDPSRPGSAKALWFT